MCSVEEIEIVLEHLRSWSIKCVVKSRRKVAKWFVKNLSERDERMEGRERDVVDRRTSGKILLAIQGVQDHKSYPVPVRKY